MHIVPATAEDIGSAVAIYEALNVRKKSIFWWTNPMRLREDLGELYLCKENDTIGAMSLFIGGESRIMALAVRPEKRGSGAGSALVDFAIAKAQEYGAARLWVGSDFVFHADGFYLKNGFSLYSQTGAYEFVMDITSSSPYRRRAHPSRRKGAVA